MTADPTPRAVWVGMTAAPLAWSAQLWLGWWIAGSTCADGTPEWGTLSAGAIRGLQLAIAAVALAAAGAGLTFGWREWQRSSPDAPHLTSIRGEHRIGFMAAAGVLVSGLFLFGIVLTGVATSVVSVCEFMR